MKKSIFTAIVIAAGLAMFTTGCASSRDAMQKEYDRLAAVTPEPPVRCSVDRAIDDLGVAVGVNYAFAHKLMKEYVDATTNHREYIGFLNDVKYYMEEEKLDEKAAYEKVVAGIMEQDAKAASPEEKVWPRVVAGIKAVDALSPENKLKELAPVVIATVKCISTAKELKNSFKGFDATTVEKGIACVKILEQGVYTTECLAFLTEQFKRVLVAKHYAK